MSDNDKDTCSTSGSSVPPLILDEENAEPGTLYKYRDFSNMPEQEDETPSDESAPNPRGGLESSIRVQKFPVKLYAILAQKEFQDIITWMPHGRSWKVLKPNLFESMVMPLFFEYSNYHSFNRLVNAWSFRRISSGSDRGSYYHELFLRGKPHLQKYMRRLPKTHKKLPMKKEDEPDFYKMDKESQLPPLEEIPLSKLGGMKSTQPLGLSPVHSLQMQPQMQMHSMQQPQMQMQMHSMQQQQNQMQMHSMQLQQQQQPMQNFQQQNQQMQIQQPNNGFQRMFPEGVGSNDGYDSMDGRMMMGLNTNQGYGFQGMRDPSNFRPMEFKPTMDIGGGHSNSQSPQFQNIQKLRQFQQMQFFDKPMGPPVNSMPMADDAFTRMTSYRQQC